VALRDGYGSPACPDRCCDHKMSTADVGRLWTTGVIEAALLEHDRKTQDGASTKVLTCPVCYHRVTYQWDEKTVVNLKSECCACAATFCSGCQEVMDGSNDADHANHLGQPFHLPRGQEWPLGTGPDLRNPTSQHRQARKRALLKALQRAHVGGVCPTCQRPGVVKDDKCTHMVCDTIGSHKGCGTHWCFGCGGILARTGAEYLQLLNDPKTRSRVALMSPLPGCPPITGQEAFLVPLMHNQQWPQYFHPLRPVPQGRCPMTFAELLAFDPAADMTEQFLPPSVLAGATTDPESHMMLRLAAHRCFLALSKFRDRLAEGQAPEAHGAGPDPASLVVCETLAKLDLGFMSTQLQDLVRNFAYRTFSVNHCQYQNIVETMWLTVAQRHWPEALRDRVPGETPDSVWGAFGPGALAYEMARLQEAARQPRREAGGGGDRSRLFTINLGQLLRMMDGVDAELKQADAAMDEDLELKQEDPETEAEQFVQGMLRQMRQQEPQAPPQRMLMEMMTTLTTLMQAADRLERTDQPDTENTPGAAVTVRLIAVPRLRRTEADDDVEEVN